MNILVLNGEEYTNVFELNRAVEKINQLQGNYQLLLSKVDWIKDPIKKKIIDYDLVYKEKQTIHENEPVIIITQNPLKKGMEAYDFPNFYIFTTAGRRTRYQNPPQYILMMYFIAGILGNFDCDLPVKVSDSMIHEGDPIGCISDYCEEEGDLFISMKKAHICDACKQIYSENGLPKKSIESIEKILVYVKEVAVKYDKEIPYNAFISYSRKDKDIAEKVIVLLENARNKVWYDDFSLLVGKKIRKELEQGIKNSECFIILLSPDSIESKWCNDELKIAIGASQNVQNKQRVEIIPALIKECDIPSTLDSYKFADLIGDKFERGMEEILNAMQEQKSSLMIKRLIKVKP